MVKDAHFNFDVHNLTGAGLDKTGAQKHFSQLKGHTIPYRCLLPETTENLLLCGRNISGTHMAHSNFKVMPICVGTGEAPGMAAGKPLKITPKTNGFLKKTSIPTAMIKPQISAAIPNLIMDS